MLKIIAGEFRSRILEGPPDAETTRPITARVKESVFNLLRGWCEDAVVLDLFAGVGAIGLEAVSRGAREVVFVELNGRIASILEFNVTELGCGDRATVVRADALGPAALAQAPRDCDLVFLDPPYPLWDDLATRERLIDLAARTERKARRSEVSDPFLCDELKSTGGLSAGAVAGATVGSLLGCALCVGLAGLLMKMRGGGK